MQTPSLEALQAQVEVLQQQVAALQRRRRRTTWGVLVVLVSGLAVAQVPNVFTADTPARASEVNANFDFLNTRINSLITQLTSKIGAPMTTTSVTTGGLTINGGLTVIGSGGTTNFGQRRLSNVAQPIADTDVVTKAHLKQLLANTIFYVNGNCPTGTEQWTPGIDRFPRGLDYAIGQSAGSNWLDLHTESMQVAAANSSGASFLTGVRLNGTWGGGVNIIPSHVNLRPCVLSMTY